MNMMLKIFDRKLFLKHILPEFIKIIARLVQTLVAKKIVITRDIWMVGYECCKEQAGSRMVSYGNWISVKFAETLEILKIVYMIIKNHIVRNFQ